MTHILLMWCLPGSFDLLSADGGPIESEGLPWALQTALPQMAVTNVFVRNETSGMSMKETMIAAKLLWTELSCTCVIVPLTKQYSRNSMSSI